MDAARQQAIEACGRCGQPGRAHQHAAGTDEGDLALFAALGGPCTSFVASDAAVIYARHLAIADNRAPAYRAGRIGRRLRICERCGHRGHAKENCPL